MYALINNDKVVVQVQTKIAEGFIKVDNNVYCGMVYDGVKFNKPEPKLYVPQTISPRQARLILLQYGLLDDIESLIATDRALGIWWEYSLDIKRDDEYILGVCNALGITSEQLDQMFTEASNM